MEELKTTRAALVAKLDGIETDTAAVDADIATLKVRRCVVVASAPKLKKAVAALTDLIGDGEAEAPGSTTAPTTGQTEMILDTLDKPRTAKQIERKTGLDSKQVSNTITRLVRAGKVHRAPGLRPYKYLAGPKPAAPSSRVVTPVQPPDAPPRPPTKTTPSHLALADAAYRAMDPERDYSARGVQMMIQKTGLDAARMPTVRTVADALISSGKFIVGGDDHRPTFRVKP